MKTKTTNIYKTFLILDSLKDCYNQKEFDLIFKYLLGLSNYATDVEFIGETITDKADCTNYTDNLSFVLTEKTGVGQPVFILSTAVYDLLATVYDKRELSVLTPESVLKLYDCTPRLDWTDCNLEELERHYKQHLLKTLKEFTLPQLLDFFKTFSQYTLNCETFNTVRTLDLYSKLSQFVALLELEELELIYTYIIDWGALYD